MKINWQIKKLGEVCDVIAGQSPEGKFYNKSGNGLPFYQGKKEFGEKFIGKPTTWTTKITKEALDRDILMSVRAPVGPTNFSTQRICIGRGLAVIRAGKNIDKYFLFNFLQLFESEIVGNKGAVFDSISKTQIENIEILLPPLTEQRRIVKILDEVFADVAKAKENAEKNLQNAKELFESYLQNIFTITNGNFENRKIKDIAELKGGKRVPRGYKLKNDKTEYPYIRVADFNDSGSVDLNDIRYIDKNIFDQIRRYTISTKDLYISIAGTIGKTGIIPQDLEGANLTENACKLVFKDNIYNKYIYYFTKSREFIEQAGLNTRKVAMPKLALSRLGSIMMPIPKDFTEQKSIVKKLDTLSAETKKLETIYKQKLVDLGELNKSILKKAFSGEL